MVNTALIWKKPSLKHPSNYRGKVVITLYLVTVKVKLQLQERDSSSELFFFGNFHLDPRRTSALKNSYCPLQSLV